MNIENMDKEQLLSKIEENPEIINNWPIEKLKKLEKIYDSIIKENEKEIEKLNKK